jgi:uncharacterized heparinase superfamily protein
MQAGEVLWRGQQQLIVRSGSLKSPTRTVPPTTDHKFWVDALERFREGADRPVLLDRRHAHTISQRKPQLVGELIDKAEQTVNSDFTFFGHPTVRLGLPIDWSHDPVNNVHWPNLPARKIDHRTAGGDAKWIWELNRLQHLPWLAQAWLFTAEERFSQAAFNHLDTWIDQNIPGRGIAWRGAFEAGLRGISVALAVQGFRDSSELTPERYRRVFGMLAYSADLCWRERSRFSSANNHLIGEMAGLAVISMLFPEMHSAARWEQRALRTLSDEARKQILPDGAGAEQSVGYQMATVELLHLVASLLVARDGYAPEAITDAIARSSAFLADVVDGNDPDPRNGDSDQEFAIRLGPELVRTVREHLGLVAGVGTAPASPGSDCLSAEWYRTMARPSAASRHHDSAGHTPSQGKSFYAPDGGLVVLRSGQRRAMVDVGPLGYLSIAAHGHADALSVTISEDGHDIVGDPGTGSYYRHPQWRSAMRGTRAHATVCVDEQDQSVIGGPFLWSRHAQTRVRGVDLRAGVVDAEHDGYTRLAGHVVHRRWVIAEPEDRALLVVDLITGAGVHTARTSWPLHPSVDAVLAGDSHLLSRGGRPILQMMHAATDQFAFDDKYGDEKHALGWWSDRLESRVPSWWLSAVCRSELPIVLATVLSPADTVATSDLAVTLDSESIEVRWTEDGVVRALSIDTDGSAAVSRDDP